MNQQREYQANKSKWLTTLSFFTQKERKSPSSFWIPHSLRPQNPLYFALSFLSKPKIQNLLHPHLPFGSLSPLRQKKPILHLPRDISLFKRKPREPSFSPTNSLDFWVFVYCHNPPKPTTQGSKKCDVWEPFFTCTGSRICSKDRLASKVDVERLLGW